MLERQQQTTKREPQKHRITYPLRCIRSIEDSVIITYYCTSHQHSNRMPAGGCFILVTFTIT